jgi:predicted nucleic acid-binding protein
MDKVVIADTSCLIALDKINHLYILQLFFTSINITKQIHQEFGNQLPDWFIIHEVVSLESLNCYWMPVKPVLSHWHYLSQILL